MKKTLLTLLIAMFIATPAMAAIVDNDEIYIWGDPDGDMYDAYAEVHPGDTIRLNIFVNDLNGSTDMTRGTVLVNENWTHATNGAWTCIWWDNAVVDGSSIYEDGDGIDTDNDPLTGDANGWEIQNKFKVWMGSTGNNAHGATYWYKHYDNWNDYGWVAEGRLIISMNLTIREDAPIGMTEIGLEQAFFWSNNMFDEYGGYFFKDRIEVGENDPFAMKLMVLPAGRAGDFDGDGDIDADDIDALAAAIQASSTDTIYDMDGDGDVDADDFAFHVHNLVDTALGEGTGTEFGDFNLDGMVSILDLGALGDGYGVGTGWAQGDANGDGTVGILDLGFLGDNYGYDGSAIPEPATMSLLGLGAVAILRRRRR